ncbi:MAG: hypothetical protein KatS3mg103_0624 [Phycisphaerales bacterium]|nr:MAG: hypothetical protein KatS3mg103_0624 [Phycisphaerales bacterium]
MARDYYYTDHQGQPAGPVPLETLRQMHQRGQLAPDALVAEVGADRWQPAADVLGLEPAAAHPPVLPGGSIGRPQEAFEPLAGWAFGLGMASWACLGILAGIPAVICGHVALSRMKAQGNTNGSAKVLAIIGLVLGYVSIAATAAMLALFMLGMLSGLAGP